MSLAIRTLHDTRDRWYIPRKPLTARPPRQKLMRKTPVKNEIVKVLSRGIPLTTVPLTPCQSTVSCGNGWAHLMVPHEHADPLRPVGGVKTVTFILRRYRVPGPLRPPVTNRRQARQRKSTKFHVSSMSRTSYKYRQRARQQESTKVHVNSMSMTRYRHTESLTNEAPRIVVSNFPCNSTSEGTKPVHNFRNG